MGKIMLNLVFGEPLALVQVGQLWQPDTVGSSIGEYSWSMCPWSNQLWHVPWSLGLTLLVWVVMQCPMCPIMVESKVEGYLHWTLGASQGMVECWAQKHCPYSLSDGVRPISEWLKLEMGRNNAPSINVTNHCHPLRTCVALDVDHDTTCT